jgi:hypothetical protein
VKKRQTRASSGTAQPDTGTYPQLRMVALVTCGTRALPGAVSGPLLGKGTGEQTLARGLLDRLRPGMLLLADRGFCSFALRTAARGTGAHLLWRVKDSLHLPVMQELPDGSCLTRIHDPRAVHARLAKNGTRRRRGSKLPPDTSPPPAASAITVRVIVSEVTVTAEDGTRRTRQVRLITDLTDWRACPAAELAAGYARRWTIECAPLFRARYATGLVRVSPGGVPPTSATGADVDADAACSGAPVIVDRHLAHKGVAVHGNPDAGPGARIAGFAGCVLCSARTGKRHAQPVFTVWPWPSPDGSAWLQWSAGGRARRWRS